METLRKRKIAILLATYNGEEYLRQLLDSLFAQQEKDWDLIISDDCSEDSTPSILHEYAERFPNRVILLTNKTPSGSSKNNFFSLMKRADGYDYLMFCDQDDVWKPDKVGNTLRAMMKLENEEKSVPCLVHTDLTVVDADLSIMSKSFIQSSLLDPSRCALKQLVIQNVVTGCTMMINASLREKALQQANINYIRMHDAWCALWAAAVGRIDFIPEQTIYYRQHGTNVIGAKDVGSLRYVLRYMCKGQQNHQALVDAEKQAGAFLAVAESCLNEEQKQLLRDYSTLRQKRKFERIKVIIKYGIWKTGWRRCIGEIVQI